MITQASDYRFTDVTGVDVSGKIIPTLDGTPSVAVERMEDICYLVEMARERMRWARPGSDEAENCITDYSPSDRTVSRKVMSGIRHLLSLDAFSLVDTVGAVNADFDAMAKLPLITFPYDGDVSNYAWDAFISGAAVHHDAHEPSRPMVADDMRRQYFELARVSRFFLKNMTSKSSGETFATMLSRMSDEIDGKEFYQSYHTEGPLVPDDGKSVIYEQGVGTSSYDGFRWPWFQRSWNESGASTYTVYTSHGMCMVVNKGFCFDGEKRVLPSSMPAYLHFSGECGWHSGTDYDMGSKYLRAVIPSTATDAGSADGTVFAGRGERIYTVDISKLYLFFETVRGWCAQNCTEFNQKPRYLNIQLNRVVLDTGTLELRTDLPTSWTWQPE